MALTEIEEFNTSLASSLFSEALSGGSRSCCWQPPPRPRCLGESKRGWRRASAHLDAVTHAPSAAAVSNSPVQAAISVRAPCHTEPATKGTASPLPPGAQTLAALMRNES